MNADNLTYLQKVALKGDIAHALVTCSHDADIKFRFYMILKSVTKELRPFVLEALKEAVLLNEDELNRVYFETLTDEVPVWLWTDKVIADIKDAQPTMVESFMYAINVHIIKKKLNSEIKAPDRVIKCSGTAEKLDIPFRANNIIFLRGYLVVPAVLSSLS